MKELSIKEKAKAYDEAVNEIKNLRDMLLKEGVINKNGVIWDNFNRISPELKESEDEKIISRIKKAVEFYWSDEPLDEIFAWLEKQVGHAKFINGIQVGDKVTRNEDGVLVNLSQLNRVAKKDEKQGEPVKLSEEEQNKFAKGVLTSCALSFIDYLDAHKYEGKMCVSNGECEDIENAFHNAMWDRLHRYYCKYLEKQGETFTKMDIDDAYLKGVTDTKNEIEKQYEANYQIRKDIATFIFNYRGDIKDRAKWMDYLGIKVYLVEKQGKQKPTDNVEPKFKVGDIIRLKDGDGLEWTVEEVFNNGYYTIVCADRDDFILLDDNWELVEQKPAWSEEDERMKNQLVDFMLSGIDISKAPHGCVAWLKSLKDKVIPQPKQEWSEEDKKMIGTLIAIFEVNYPDGFYKVNPIGTTNMQGIHSSEIIKWLKYLKERMKG